MANMRTLVSTSALVTTVIALLLCIVSMATEYWTSAERGVESFHSGLWRACQCDAGSCVCLSVVSVRYPIEGLEFADWFEAVQASMCLSFICGLVSSGLVAAVVVSLHCPSFKLPFGRLKYIAVFLLMLASLWTIIAVVIFAVKFEDNVISGPVYNLDWSWGLAIPTFILQIVAAALIFFIKRST